MRARTFNDVAGFGGVSVFQSLFLLDEGADEIMKKNSYPAASMFQSLFLLDEGADKELACKFLKVEIVSILVFIG